MRPAPTLVLTHPAFLRHDPGPGHPESPARLSAILELLDETPVDGVVRALPREARPGELEGVHTPAHLAAFHALRGRAARVDQDTAASPDTVEAALLAAGAAVGATEAVLEGRARNAFALVRPPGHHAEPGRAMGFCFLNNAAVAAEAARRKGAERVLVLDWDVHHGNGTQAAFWGRRDVLYQSVHQFPYYPGTGAAHEVGAGAGAGYTVNVPLPGGSTDGDMAAVFDGVLLPVARAFRPDVVLVSAGFDPHEDDPLGGMVVTTRGFAAMCSAVKALADEACGGKLVLLLEGGYSLEGTSEAAHACLEVLAGRTDTFRDAPSRDGVRAVAQAREALQGHWRL